MAQKVWEGRCGLEKVSDRTSASVIALLAIPCRSRRDRNIMLNGDTRVSTQMKSRRLGFSNLHQATSSSERRLGLGRDSRGETQLELQSAEQHYEGEGELLYKTQLPTTPVSDAAV